MPRPKEAGCSARPKEAGCSAQARRAEVTRLQTTLSHPWPALPQRLAHDPVTPPHPRP